MPDHPRLPSFAPDALPRFLDATRLGARQAYKALTVWPLVAEPAPPAALPYVALADATAAGTFHVEEVSAAGAVPNVAAENTGDVAVLVLFGEEMRGAKQNRIANASFLVGPKSRVVLDVSCVEQGRWEQRSRQFTSSGDVLSAAIRRKMAPKVQQARAAGMGFRSDQMEVWEDVSVRLRSSGTLSRTSAYADHLETRAGEMDEASRAFAALPGQVGFVASVGDAVAGLELVGRPEVFARTFPALLRAYLVDALDHVPAPEMQSGAFRVYEAGEASDGGGDGTFDAPEAFLEAVAAAPTQAGPSLGLGEDVRLSGPRTAGCALFAGSLVHLTAFPQTAEAR